MPTLTISAVRQQIASGEVDPIYLLQGEDDVEKSALAAEFVLLGTQVARHLDGVDDFAGGVFLQHDRRDQRAREVVGHLLEMVEAEYLQLLVGEPVDQELADIRR